LFLKQVATHLNTYSAFPVEMYRDFINTYVVPYGNGFKDSIDLGCGTAGLIRQIDRLYSCNILGVDISKISIDHCIGDPDLQKPNIEFIQDAIMHLLQRTDFKGRQFDLIVSYSVFHMLNIDTASMFEFLKRISKPGAIIAIDALPCIRWNSFFFSVVKLFFQLKIGGIAVRLIGPLVLPNRSRTYINELSKLDYMKYFRPSNFIDLSYFDSSDFRASFELLRLDIVRQDTFFTGRKARFTLKRLPS